MLGMRNRFLLNVGEGGGGGTAVVDAPETETGEGEAGTEEIVEGEGAGEGEEGTQEGEGTGEEGEGEPTGPAGEPTQKTVPLGSLVEIRRENAKLKERLEAMDLRLGEHASIVDKLKPPEKDALEGWYEGLPDGNLESDKPQEKDAAELKQDAGLLLRVMKHPEFRKALFAPMLPLMQAMFRSMDLNSWQNEQATETLAALLGDEELSAKLGDKIPAGMKHRDRVLKHHQEMVTKSGGRWIPVRDAFAAVQEQLKAEGSAAGRAAVDATARTLKEVTQRRTATGGPRSEGIPSRGGPAKPGKRTFEQIMASEGDFLVP